MKKLLLLSMITLFALGLNAQDYKKVTTAVLLNKMEDAKTEIDKIAADPKGQAKAETYYYKARIYAALNKDLVVSKKYTNLVADADVAFKKLVSMDPIFAQVKEKGADPIFDLYSYGFNNGIRAFNEKKWDSAFNYFTFAVEYSDFIFQNKLSKDQTMAFDTTSLLYAGYSGQNANKAELACKYYGRLAEAHVATDGYLDVYKFLIITYMNNKNETAFKKYIGLAKTVFAKENWEDYEVEYIDRNFSLAEKVNYYEKAETAGTLTEMQYLQFGEIFINVKHDEKEKGKFTSDELNGYERKGIEAYKKAFGKNSQNPIAAYNVGVIYYNNFGILDDTIAANIKKVQAINSSKPSEKDPKKKAAMEAKFKAQTDPILKANQDLIKPINENMDQAIEWLEKTYTIEKTKTTGKTSTDKSIGNKTVDFLANMFQYKRDLFRGKDVKAYDAFDAKYKLYDVEHDKF